MPERRTSKNIGLKDKTGNGFMTDTGQPVFDSKNTAVCQRRFSPTFPVPMSRLPSPPAYLHCLYAHRCVAAAPFAPEVALFPAKHASLAFASFTFPSTPTF